MKEQGILYSNQTFFSIAQRTLDVLVIIYSLYLTTLYLGIEWGREHTTLVAVATFIFHFTSDLGGLYISWRGQSVYREVKKAFTQWFMTASILYFGLIFFKSDYLSSSELKSYWFLYTLFGLAFCRLCVRFFLKTLRGQGMNTRTVVVAGAGELGARLVQNINNNQSLGLLFKGYYDDDTNQLDSLGNLDQLVIDCKDGGVDKVYLALPMRAEKRIKWLTKELADTTVSVYLVPDIFMFNILHSRVDIISGIPTMSIYDSPLQGTNAVIKRIEDLILSILILIVISPALLLIAIAVRLTSKGPILFKQLRYGIDGKPIQVWKFRSMKVMEDGSNVRQAKKNDSRFTPIGSFIRRTSLDELPQFLNVLQGHMSIVGPRPHAIAHNEEYRKLIEGYMLRHKVKPGITGWAQINGWRGETDTLNKMEKRIEFDLEYIRNWSLWFDLKIIIKTLKTGFINHNAY
jgi:putative colanic acid biosynthesis UDP-glucose lipid carrier transferase